MLPDWYHNFTLMPFINKEHLEIYLRDPEYNYNDTKPGLCFAFEINKFSD